MKQHLSIKFHTWYSTLKLKQKVRYLFLILIGSYFILFFSVYMLFFKKNMMKYTLDSNLNTMISVGNNLNSELNTINSMSRLLMTNSNVLDYLQNQKNSISPRFSQKAISAMYEISNNFHYINSIYVFNNQDEYIHIANGITKLDKSVIERDDWYNDLASAKGRFITKINGDGAFSTKSGDPVLSFMRVINDIETQKPIGMLIINLSSNLLVDTYKDMRTRDRQFLYYYHNNPILEQEEVQTESVPFDFMELSFHQKTIGSWGKEQVYSYYKVPQTPFIILCIEKMPFMEMIPGQASWIILLLIVVTVCSLLAIGIFITLTITSPIERLVQSMDFAKDGWLKRVSLHLPDDEIGHLKNSYNDMLIAINHLIHELLEKEKSIQQSELLVLQEQIKPHFLYNTLDTIGYLALQESGDKVYDAIETLGNFYRRFLSKGSKEITIEEEVRIVKDYLTLQKLRYEDAFEDQYDIQEDLLQHPIPKLILQPLVENSLYHGIRLKGEKGIIKVSIFSEENHMHILVYDSGIGMNKEQIRNLMEDNKKSFGFKGTIERIQYYYNQEDVFFVHSEEGLFTEVHIKIPL